jgi:hypothetical protein
VTFFECFSGVAKDLMKITGKSTPKLVTKDGAEGKLFRLVAWITGECGSAQVAQLWLCGAQGQELCKSPMHGSVILLLLTARAYNSRGLPCQQQHCTAPRSLTRPCDAGLTPHCAPCSLLLLLLRQLHTLQA